MFSLVLLTSEELSPTTNSRSLFSTLLKLTSSQQSSSLQDVVTKTEQLR